MSSNRWCDMGTYVTTDPEESWSDQAMDCIDQDLISFEDGFYFTAEESYKLALESVLRWTNSAATTMSDRDIIDAVHSVTRSALGL